MANRQLNTQTETRALLLNQTKKIIADVKPGFLIQVTEYEIYELFLRHATDMIYPPVTISHHEVFCTDEQLRAIKGNFRVTDIDPATYGTVYHQSGEFEELVLQISNVLLNGFINTYNDPESHFSSSFETELAYDFQHDLIDEDYIHAFFADHISIPFIVNTFTTNITIEEPHSTP